MTAPVRPRLSVTAIPSRPIWQSSERQTRTWQKKIVGMALEAGDVSGLCWYIEYVLPAAKRRTFTDKLRPARLHGWVPVVPLSPFSGSSPLSAFSYVEYSEEMAGLLGALMEERYQEAAVRAGARLDQRETQFMPVLSQFETLTEHRVPWFVWGEAYPWQQDETDICAVCGGLSPCPCQERYLYLVGADDGIHLSRAGRLMCGETSSQWRWAHAVGDLSLRRRAVATEPVTCLACLEAYLEQELA